MDKNNIVSLRAAKEIREAELADRDYKLLIDQMDKVELLNEMVRFQEDRSRNGQLTPTLMIRGRVLFKALEEHAETEALRSLSRSYRRHLDFELKDYMEAQSQ